MVLGDYMKIKKTNQNVLNEEEIEKKKARKSAQDWLPLMDIINGLSYTKDGYVVGYLIIEPFNLDLFNVNEQEEVIFNLAEALNGLDEPFVWYATDRPADIEPYIDDLKHKAEIANKTIKKIILGKYATTARNQVMSGELVEKKFYMAVRLKNEKKVEILLRQRLDDISQYLSTVGLQVKMTTDKNVYELFSMFADPSSSLFDSGNYNEGAYPQYVGD